jgi:hypothetical protein
MKVLRSVVLAAALGLGAVGSAYAHDSFGLSVNIGIPGYAIAAPVQYVPPPSVRYVPAPVVYYEPAPVRYYAPTGYVYYRDARPYYGYGREEWRHHHRHFDRD